MFTLNIGKAITNQKQYHQEKMVTNFLKTRKKTSGDQLTVENPKLPKTFPQTLSEPRSARQPIPFSRFKTQSQRGFYYAHVFQGLFKPLFSLSGA